MAGFQNFTPRTANLAEVWKGFNPAANFLGGMKTMRQMGLDEAEEARLQESAEVDRMVKETLLPLQVEESRAKIGLTLAQRDYAASRASRAADEASALSVFERSPNDRSQILRILGLDDDEVVSPEIRSGGGGGASILNATPSSGGGFESFDLSASNTKNPIVAEFSPKEEETGPLYNLSENKTLLASSDPFGVPDTGGQTNLKSLTTASALTPKGPTMRNAADWDEDNTNFSPLEKKNPLTSLEIPEDKRKEIERLNDETGALNKNQDQAAPTSEEDIGAYLVKGLNKLEKAKDRAQLAQSGPEKRFVSGLTLKLEDLTYREAAKKLGIDPDMGEYAVKALTRSGVNGMRRSPSQINQIVDLVKNGQMDFSEASTFFDAKARKELENKLNGETEKDTSQEDLTKSLSNLNAAQEAYAKAQSTGDQRQISAAKIGLELAEDNTNRVSGGRLYLERHQSNQNSILQALGNQGNPKINWGGVAYDDPSLKNSQDPTAKLSAEQYLASQVTNGTIPTVTFTKNANGEVIANADAASNYLNKVGAKQTLVASWDGPELKWFTFTPSEKQGKQLVPLTKKAPPPASDAKKSSEAASPNESGKRLGGAVKPALQKTANFLKGPTADELLNRADYVATGIRNNITAPAVEWAAGVAGEDLDMGRTPNPSIADRDKKQLTAKERAAILSRTQNPLTNLFLNK